MNNQEKLEFYNKVLSCIQELETETLPEVERTDSEVSSAEVARDDMVRETQIKWQESGIRHDTEVLPDSVKSINQQVDNLSGYNSMYTLIETMKQQIPNAKQELEAMIRELQEQINAEENKG